MDMTVAMTEEALVFDATREMRERAEQYRQRIARLEALVREAMPAIDQTMTFVTTGSARCAWYMWLAEARAELEATVPDVRA